MNFYTYSFWCLTGKGFKTQRSPACPLDPPVAMKEAS